MKHFLTFLILILATGIMFSFGFFGTYALMYLFGVSMDGFDDYLWNLIF